VSQIGATTKKVIGVVEEKLDTLEFLEEPIREGENERIEFKARTPPDAQLARVLTAFANTNGGLIVIGVNQEGEVVGISSQEADDFEARVSSLAPSLDVPLVQWGSGILKDKIVSYASIDPVPDDSKPVLTSRAEAFTRRGTEEVRFEYRSAEPASVPPVSSDYRRAFVAMSLRDEEEPALVDYFNAVERAATRCRHRLKLFRIDMQEGDFEIFQEVMNQIDKCDLVLVDFTLNPANRYFEVGLGVPESL
jgi:hypothetical protein